QVDDPERQLGGLVAENEHAAEGADKSADDGHREETGLRNAKPLAFGPQLVISIEYEGNQSPGNEPAKQEVPVRQNDQPDEEYGGDDRGHYEESQPNRVASGRARVGL